MKMTLSLQAIKLKKQKKKAHFAMKALRKLKCFRGIEVAYSCNLIPKEVCPLSSHSNGKVGDWILSSDRRDSVRS
jgi:hypothetical protein